MHLNESYKITKMWQKIKKSLLEVFAVDDPRDETGHRSSFSEKIVSRLQLEKVPIFTDSGRRKVSKGKGVKIKRDKEKIRKNTLKKKTFLLCVSIITTYGCIRIWIQRRLLPKAV